CLGYPFEGAQGFEEGDTDRLVNTPWSEEQMPFSEAAEYGTSKVITDHSTIGVLVSTDGSILDLPREGYLTAEKRVVREMKELNKPFVLLLNSKHPQDSSSMRLRDELADEYGIPVMLKNVQEMSAQDMSELLEVVLMQFPLRMVDVAMPSWMQALPRTSEIITHIINKVCEVVKDMQVMGDHKRLSGIFDDDEYLLKDCSVSVDYGKGTCSLHVTPQPQLFYRVLSEQCGMEIADECQLVTYIKEFASARTQYEKLKQALADVESYGYGVVTPSLEDMQLQSPQIVRKGSRYGIKLKASAPAMHIMRVDVETEVNPVISSDMQNEANLKAWLEEFGEDGQGIWNTNMFGKSLNVIAKEGLNNKLMAMPEDVRGKLRRTVTRIVNEGKGGVLCILL
ncbi:MAG: stage IV sporulation protein A, partial [Clostridia bacterium]|nr:stage IV sporulation protein A [Clostridia bacterium]